jgi:hypothetical protein
MIMIIRPTAVMKNGGIGEMMEGGTGEKMNMNVIVASTGNTGETAGLTTAIDANTGVDPITIKSM